MTSPESSPLTSPGARPIWGGFESTYLPYHDRDCLETGGHDRRWRQDLAALREAGVRELRYPVRWHRVEQSAGAYDWRETDRVLGSLRDAGLSPVLDLIHHTSYPRWLDGGFADPRFGPAYVRFAEAAATRYPWLASYTLFNEPFATLFLAGHEGLWPPYRRGVPGLVSLLRNVLPAVAEASRCWSELLPEARHVWVDTCEHHSATPGPQAQYAALCNDRRFMALDLALKHDLDPDRRPYLRSLVAAGGADLLELEPVRIDVLGLDYYAHSEWHYDSAGGHTPSPYPLGLAALIEQYAGRYRLPLALTETNIRGLPSDRASWLRYTLEQYELAASRGVPLEGYCWFPVVDSCDWDSLLARPGGRVDPVGVWSLDPDGTLRETSMTAAWRAAVAGASARELPAYRFQSPVAERLSGLLPQMAHWAWQDPPAAETVPPVQVALPDVDPPAQRPVGTGPGAAAPGRAAGGEEKPVPTAPSAPTPSAPAVLRAASPGDRRAGDDPVDLVVFSHLRWVFVWQRPQHLVSRLAHRRTAAGARTWFVEEPIGAPVAVPTLRVEPHDGVNRVWLEVSATDRERRSFGAPGTERYAELLRERLGEGADADAWLYTPAALPLAEALEPRLLVYDVMDDLAAFVVSDPGVVALQREALARADLVFAGGRSLHRGVLQHRDAEHTHLFPSGVESRHYASARAKRRPHAVPVAGYVGVIDERLDLDLLADLARKLPDWEIQVHGPVVKIDLASLPQAPNLRYPGRQPYEALPAVMAGFDVALMPFALNEATRSISPTKTLEYLAAGLPVVSTRVPDVVTDFGEVVHLADTGEEFAEACREVLSHRLEARDARVAPIRMRLEWDTIAGSMAALIREAVERKTGTTVDLTRAGRAVPVGGAEASA